MTPTATSHDADLAAVRRAARDDDVFAELVGEHRAALRAHCYRMLGSLADTDDAVQETVLRAWRSLDSYEGRSSVRTWLVAIATNVCLRALERRSRRHVPEDGPPARLGERPGRPRDETYWLEPMPTELADVDGATPDEEVVRAERVELAFVAALQHLPPLQRAVLLLREVLAYSARESAAILGTTVAAVNSAGQRARATLAAGRPAESQQSVLRRLGDRRVAELVDAYASAMRRHDLDAVLRLLTADASWSMPPEATWYAGREAVARFLVDFPFRSQWRHRPCSANGQAAVLCERWRDDEQTFAPYALDVLTLRGDRIAAVTAFRSPAVLARFAP